VEKQSSAGQVTDDNVIGRIKDAHCMSEN